MDPEEIECLSFVKRSKNRKKIVTAISQNILLPSEISEITHIRINHVSTYLVELSEKGIVTCLNETAKKGRLYKLTDRGKVIERHLLHDGKLSDPACSKDDAQTKSN